MNGFRRIIEDLQAGMSNPAAVAYVCMQASVGALVIALALLAI